MLTPTFIKIEQLQILDRKQRVPIKFQVHIYIYTSPWHNLVRKGFMVYVMLEQHDLDEIISKCEQQQVSTTNTIIIKNVIWVIT